MRVHVHAVRMTLHRADVLEAYLNHQDSIHHATVYERTGDVVLTYTGSRKEAIALLAGYKFDNAELDVLVTSNDSRKINREYQDKMFTLVAGHYARKLFLPAPIAAAYTIWRSIAFVWKGIRCLLQRKLEVEVLDALSISAVLTAALLIWNRDLLLAFGASEQTIDYAADYMQIYAIGTVFVQLTLGMNAFITAQGFAREGMLTVLIGAVCNIVLDPILIFKLGMGVRGAALATIVSQGVSCLWVVLFLFSKKSVLKLRVQNFLQSPRLILPCVGLGTATFIMQASESVLSVCFNSSLARYGGDIAVGAMTILTSVMQFALLPLQGISQGAQPILSYNYGAKNVERVRKTFRVLLTVCLTYSALIWAFVMLCPRVFAGIFTPDADLIEFTGRALRIYCAVLAIFGIQQACQITFVSIGKAVCSIIVAVMRKFVLLIPLIYLMPHLVPDPTLGVYLAEPVADTLAVTFTSILFSHQFRKALRTLESERSA